MSNLSKKEIIAELWRRAELSWLLDSNQKKMYELYDTTTHRTLTWLLARRSGKTRTLCIIALIQCLRNPKSIVKFISPTKLQAKTNALTLFRDVLESCPDHIKPEYKKNEYTYYFPNGSELHLAGSDSGHAEKLRGSSSHLSIIDEAQDVNDLEYIVKSILLPASLTTNGKIIISGTPPKASEHDFLKFIEDAEFKGTLTRKTIYDNPRLTPELIEEMKIELGGERSEAFRRECLCEIIKDATTSVLPEFTPDLEKEIVKEWPRPPFFDAYVSMDLGYNDLTAVVFGYYDFRAGKIVIDDELVMDFTQPENTIVKLAKEIRNKESNLWIDHITNEVRKPYLRVSDINHIVTSEIYKVSNRELHFSVPPKDDNDAAINTLRVMLAAKKIIIHPRCVNLIRHLRNVKWAGTAKKNFARSAENGHYDLVDALKYLIRSVVYTKNPYPGTYDLNTQDLYMVNPQKFQGNAQIDALKKVFGLRRK
jgi:hypothetical protein